MSALEITLSFTYEKKLKFIVQVTSRPLGCCDILFMHVWRIPCLQILFIILRLALVLGSAVSASPRVDESQSFSIPDLVHQKQPNGNESDDDDGKSRSAFGQRDDENNNGDDDLHDCVQMNPQVTLDTVW